MHFVEFQGFSKKEGSVIVTAEWGCLIDLLVLLKIQTALSRWLLAFFLWVSNVTAAYLCAFIRLFQEHGSIYDSSYITNKILNANSIKQNLILTLRRTIALPLR